MRVINLSVPGFRIDDLDRLLEQPLVQYTVKSADGILFEIGGNDLNDIRDAYRADNELDVKDAANRVIGEWNAVVKTITDMARKAGGVPVLTFTLYYPYVNEDNDDQLGVLLHDALTPYNDAVTSAAEDDVDFDVYVADVFTAFNDWRGRLVDPEGFPKWYLAFDDFHPNYRGHSRIAQELCDLPVVY